jgi:hypothetical protein
MRRSAGSWDQSRPGVEGGASCSSNSPVTEEETCSIDQINQSAELCHSGPLENDGLNQTGGGQFNREPIGSRSVKLLSSKWKALTSRKPNLE